MQLRANRKMEALLTQLAMKGLKGNADKMENFKSLIESSVIEIQGCFFLSAFVSEGHSSSNTLPLDATGEECFVNHFHIEDYIRNIKLSNDILFHYGFRLAFIVLEKLKILRKKHDFNIIIAISKGSCTVRFHKVRVNDQWLDPNLENYKLDAIAVIEI